MLGQEHIPNYEYLNIKLGIKTSEELRQCIIDKCNNLDLQEMAKMNNVG
jgi:hypothetical protein